MADTALYIVNTHMDDTTLYIVNTHMDVNTSLESKGLAKHLAIQHKVRDTDGWYNSLHCKHTWM